MDADQENRDVAKASRKSRRKSSILKDSPGRPPLAKVEVNAPAKRFNKRVSFADTHTIKEFLALVGANTEWNSSYETPANVVDSASTMDLTNQSFSLDPEKKGLEFGNTEEQFLCGQPNQTLSVNDTISVPIAHSTMLPSPNVELEQQQQQQELEKVVSSPSEEENEDTAGSSDFLSNFLGIKKYKGTETCSSSVAASSSGNGNHKSIASKPSKVREITVNKTLDMEVTHANIGGLYKDSMVEATELNDSDSPLGILSSLPNLKKTTDIKNVSVLHSEKNIGTDQTKMNLTDIDMTEAVLPSHPLSKVETAKYDNLEVTEALLAPNLVSYREIEDDRKIVTGTDGRRMEQENMEMTEALNSLLQSKESMDKPNVSKHNASMNDKTKMNLGNMEITKPVLSTISLRDPDEMEITRQKITTNKTRASLADMEMTKPVNPSQLKVYEMEHSILEKSKRSKTLINKEMTEEVMSFTEEETKGCLANMEMTEALVPSELRNLVSAGCMEINQEGVSYNKTRMSYTNMEMTEAIMSSQFQDIGNKGFETGEEVALSNNTRMALANMEMTEAVVPFQHQGAENKSDLKICKGFDLGKKDRMSVANMETTEVAIPCIAMQEVSRKDRIETEPENMEMTEAVKLSQSLITTASEISQKCGQKMNMEHMETTESLVASQCMEYFHGIEVKDRFKSGEDKTENLANMEMTEAVVPSQLRDAENTDSVEISKEVVPSNKTRMSLPNMEITEAVMPFISVRGSHAEILSKSMNFGKNKKNNLEVTEAVRAPSSVTVEPPNVKFTGHEISEKCEEKLDMENMEVTEAVIPSQHVAHEIEINKQFQNEKDKTMSLTNMEMTEAIIPSQFQGEENTNNIGLCEKNVLYDKSEAIMPVAPMEDHHVIMVSESVNSGKDETEPGQENMEMTEVVKLPQSMNMETSVVMEDINDKIKEKSGKMNKNYMEVAKSTIKSQHMEAPYEVRNQFDSKWDQDGIPRNVTETFLATGSEKSRDDKELVKQDLVNSNRINTTCLETTETILSSQLHNVKTPDMNISRQLIQAPNMSEDQMQQKSEVDINYMLEKSKDRMSSSTMETKSTSCSPPVVAEKEECEGTSRSNVSALNSSTKNLPQPFIRLLETQNEKPANKTLIQEVKYDGTSHLENLQPCPDLCTDRMVQEYVPQGSISFVKEMNNVEESSKMSNHASDISTSNSSDLATRSIKEGRCATSTGGRNQTMCMTLPNMSSTLSESNLSCNNVFDENEVKMSKLVKDTSQTEQKEVRNVQKDCRDGKNGKRSSDECEEHIQPSPKRFLTAEGSFATSHELSSQKSVMERVSNNSDECSEPFASAHEHIAMNTSVNNERSKSEISSRKEVSMYENCNKNQMKEQSCVEEELDDISLDLMDSSNSMNSGTSGSPCMQEKQSESSRRKSFFEEFASENPLYTSLMHKLGVVQDDSSDKKIGVENIPEKLEENRQNTPPKSLKDTETWDVTIENKVGVGHKESPQKTPPPISKSCNSLLSEEIICEDSIPMGKDNDIGNCEENQKMVHERNTENVKDFALKENKVIELKTDSQTTEKSQEVCINHLQSTSIIQEDNRLANSNTSVSIINDDPVDENHHSRGSIQNGSRSDEAREHDFEEAIQSPHNVTKRMGLLETSKNIQPLQTSSLESSGVFNAKEMQKSSSIMESENYFGIVSTDKKSQTEATKPRTFENISFSLSSDVKTPSKKQNDSRIERKSFITFVANLSSSRISFESMSESLHKNRDMSRNESLTSADKKYSSSSETQIRIPDEVKETNKLKTTEEMEAEICCAGCSITEGSCIDNICGIRKWEVLERTANTIKLGIQNSPLFVHLSLRKYDTHYLISSASWGPQSCELKKPMAQLVVNLFGCRANSCLIAMNSEPLCEVQKFLPSLAKTFKDMSDLLLELFQVSAKHITKFEEDSVKITLSSVEAHVSIDIWLHLTQPFEDPWQPYTIEPNVTVTIGNIRHSTFHAAITGVAEGPFKILRMADAAYLIIKNMV
ncbi:uncharacterized protein LOC143038503 [Oratosquilla oratoria]|uniref:uncharacterized protein LOC143038503 n=1 Tax=Oratosquilla oratoria TaxID=337810 RepID=UPI003F770C30